MTRSLQIRSLSMPPERLDENASHFYQQFNDNFMRIKALIRENREVLDTRVYRLLKKYPDISEQDADKLIEFSDALADTRTLEMVDVQLAWMIVNVLEPYYDTLRREKSDPEYTYKYIHCLFRHQALSYNVVQLCDRGRTTDPLSERYRDGDGLRGGGREGGGFPQAGPYVPAAVEEKRRVGAGGPYGGHC